MKLEPVYVLGVQPDGVVQLKDVALGADAVKVMGVPAVPELRPLTTAWPGIGVIVTFLIPGDPFPQLFRGVAVILPELPGVLVKLEPVPVVPVPGIQPDGVVQLKLWAFAAEAVNVIGVPTQPIAELETVAEPGSVQFVFIHISKVGTAG